MVIEDQKKMSVYSNQGLKNAKKDSGAERSQVGVIVPCLIESGVDQHRDVVVES
ncbi:MAG: hypothetical protein ACI97A_001751 [Planctomycetota bacterium]|jgi:hypothetical protein